ncbi:MAG: hypothetical protein KDA74_04170, partial [Planctomycetaceae bacterium]|nr:hypothetical protein [Planctomycetaceae bacterium]
EARLQRPLGGLYDSGRVFVGDTYNHKLKAIDLKTNEVKTFLGTGKDGNSLHPVEFSEPSGLAKVGNRLFVADTNNQRICVVNLDDNKVSEFKIAGLTPPSLPKAVDDSFTAAADKTLKVAPQKVIPGVAVKINVSPRLPAEYKLSPLAPVKFTLKSAENPDVVLARGKGAVEGDRLVLQLPAMKQLTGTYVLNLRFGYCRDGVGGLCKQHSAQWNIPLQAEKESKNDTVSLSLDLSKE